MVGRHLQGEAWVDDDRMRAKASPGSAVWCGSVLVDSLPGKQQECSRRLISADSQKAGLCALC